MRITELLTKETIAMDLDASDKSGVITELVNQLDKAGKLSDPVSVSYTHLTLPTIYSV